MEKEIKISIIILHWKNIEDTLECLKSVQALDYSLYDVIVVDNGSEDHSKLSYFTGSNIQLLRLPANLGFAEGNNYGIRLAIEKGAELVVLLNNDTVVHPSFLKAFVSASVQYPEAGVFGAKIYYYDDPLSIWYAGGIVNFIKLRCGHIGCTEDDLSGNFNKISDTEYACGCALAVTRKAIETCGILDPRFFLLWEEVDWCWRIRQKGFRCLFVPEAKVWHKISRSFEGGNQGTTFWRYYFRNRLLFLERHGTPKEIFTSLCKSLIKEYLGLIWAGYLKKRISPEERLLKRASLAGIKDYLFRQFGPIK